MNITAFSKRANLSSTSASVLRQDYETCDTEVFIQYEIKDETYLRLLDKRYYLDEETGTEKELLYEDESSHKLIGKKMKFFSPCTCNSKEGICSRCYGGLYEMNKDLFSVGSYAATKSSEPIGQMVLSTKHSQVTSSDALSFNPEFDEVCELSSTDISLSDTLDDDNLFGLKLGEVFVEESDDENFYYVKEFDFVDIHGQALYHIHEDNDASMYLSPELLSIWLRMKDKSKVIAMDSIDDDAILFTVDIKSKESNQAIKLIEKVLNRKDRGGLTSVSDICQLMADTFINLGIQYNLVHFECILRGIIRKKSNQLEFPEWGPDGDHDDYQVMQINSGLEHNPSALVSLSYGNIKRQLIGTELYEKTGTSHLDALFVRNLSEFID